MTVKVIFVLGNPGSGKTTQCRKIAKYFGFKHISTGDLLREESKRCDTENGEMIRDNIVNGVIVSGEIVCKLIGKAMEEGGDKFLIDSFPRNMENLHEWTEKISEKAELLFVLLFDCPKEQAGCRCLKRGEMGSGRSDDNSESLDKRFYIYRKETKPIIEKYDRLNLLRRIDASADVDGVYKALENIFEAAGLKKVNK